MDPSIIQSVSDKFGKLSMNNCNSMVLNHNKEEEEVSSSRRTISLVNNISTEEPSTRYRTITSQIQPPMTDRNLNYTTYQPRLFSLSHPSIFYQGIKTNVHNNYGGEEYRETLASSIWESRRNPFGINGRKVFNDEECKIIVDHSMSESGSQLLISFLDPNDKGRARLLFEAIDKSLVTVMNNEYGCQVFKKIIESYHDDVMNPQLQKIVYQLTHPYQIEALFHTSTNKFGSRVIINLIKLVRESPLIIMITTALSTIFYKLMTNRIGSYSILKCLELLSTKHNERLYMNLVNDCIKLATHEVGCITLNKSIPLIRGIYREKLVNEISNNSICLAQDPSGNYVLQCLLNLYKPEITKKICNEMKGHFVRLSLQKTSSHVVEKCLRSPEMHLVIQELVSDRHRFFQVARNPFGNYVIQTAIHAIKDMDNKVYKELVRFLKHNRNELGLGFGKNVIKCISKDMDSV